MTTITIVIVCVAAYLLYGYVRYAPRWLEIYVEGEIARLPTLYSTSKRVAEMRREGAYLAILIALVWPINMTVRALTRGIATNTSMSSVEARAQIAERDRRIEELQCELGIKDES